MARKSSLTDKQWQEIERRMIAGESARALGREFGIAESAIRKKIGAQVNQIKTVANQVIAAEQSLKSLPISAQVSAQSLIDDLRSVSLHLAGAAKFGAMTAHRLNGIANQQLDKIDDADLGPDSESMGTLRSVAILTEVANKSAQTGINLLNANKDMLKKDAEESESSSKASNMDDKTKAAKLAGFMALAKKRAEKDAIGA